MKNYNELAMRSCLDRIKGEMRELSEMLGRVPPPGVGTSIGEHIIPLVRRLIAERDALRAGK